LTGQCAVCHDHKFDPISQREFYALYAFFNSAADPGFDGNSLVTAPAIQVPSVEQEEQLAAIDARIAALEREVEALVDTLAYEDPADRQPRPEPVRTDTVWLDDDFPAGAAASGSPGGVGWLTGDAGAGVFSGQRSLDRTATGIGQDYYEKGAAPLVVPADAEIHAHVWLDPARPPRAVMLQFHVGGWNHRAFWGEEGAIPFGRVRTPEKVNMGKLPEAGKWTQLKVDIAKLGLKPGMKVDGYAFTQFDGTVYWDRLAISHRIDEANDIQWSFKVWSEKKQGSRVAELPSDLQNLVRGKKAAQWTDAERKRRFDWWMENEFQGGKEKLEGMRAEKLAEESKKKALTDQIPATLVMADLPQPRQAHVMVRGQYDKPGEAVSRG
ncbi:MAG: DUF1549 domain-containing protein, partial [Verrucomicrobiota bacterium]